MGSGQYAVGSVGKRQKAEGMNGLLVLHCFLPTVPAFCLLPTVLSFLPERFQLIERSRVKRLFTVA